MIFDSHAHYDDKAFDGDRDALLSSFPQNGIEGVVNAGADRRSVWKTLELAEQYPFVYAAVGIHPEHVGDMREEDLEWLRGLLAGARVVAVGEIGLDYYWDQTKKELQKKWFAAQLALAAEEKHPVVVHSRDAASDTLELMRSEYGKRPACIHCFSYSREMAEEFLKLDYRIGIGGVVTFKNAKKIREVVEDLPMDRILLETILDYPYGKPAGNGGCRCGKRCRRPSGFGVRPVPAIVDVESGSIGSIAVVTAYRYFGGSAYLFVYLQIFGATGGDRRNCGGDCAGAFRIGVFLPGGVRFSVCSPFVDVVEYHQSVGVDSLYVRYRDGARSGYYPQKRE